MVERETIALLGGETLRQDGAEGVGEAAMMHTYAALSPRFRWMAVAGDTVYAQGREMNFGSWAGQLQGCGATVVVCQFGRMESIDGLARLPEFFSRVSPSVGSADDRDITHRAPAAKAFEKWNLGVIGDHAPDPALLNEKLSAYTAAVRQIARDRKLIAAESPDFATALQAKVGEVPQGDLIAAIMEKNASGPSVGGRRTGHLPMATDSGQNLGNRVEVRRFSRRNSLSCCPSFLHTKISFLPG